MFVTLRFQLLIDTNYSRYRIFNLLEKDKMAICEINGTNFVSNIFQAK